MIFEYAVTFDEILLANCLCDSSYGGFTDVYHEDKRLWEDGVRRPPEQPALTRTCRRIRYDTIPMFYKFNTFQAGYCHVTDTKIVYQWLVAIGPENRTLMRCFRFFDENPDHDDYNNHVDRKRVLRGPVGREMCGTVISTYADDGCSHRVAFSVEEPDPMDGFVQLFRNAESEKIAGGS